MGREPRSKLFAEEMGQNEADEADSGSLLVLSRIEPSQISISHLPIFSLLSCTSIRLRRMCLDS